jgi:hypothetical protein
MSDEVWFAFVSELYSVRKGVRMLQAVHDGVAVQIPVDVTSFGPMESLAVCRGVLSPADDAWTGTVIPSSDIFSPTTPTGSTDALPIITNATTSNCKVVRVTVTANNPGGFENYPLEFAGVDVSGQSASSPSDYIVFHDGRSIPFFVQGMNTSSATFHVRGACREGESVFFDIFFGGAAIANTVTPQQFDPGGLDLTAMSNTVWAWRDAAGAVESVTHPSMWDIFKAPQKPGAWHPHRVGAAPANYEVRDLANLGRFQTVSGTSFTGLTNNADAVILVTPVPAAASNALEGLSLGAIDAGAIWYLEHGGTSFKQATGSGSTWSVPGAIMIAIITNDAYPNVVVEQDNANGPPRLSLNTAYDPTIAIGAAEDAVALTGTLTNTLTGDVITFSDCYYRSQNLIIDTLGTAGTHTRRYYTAVGSPIYPGTPNGGVKFSNDKQWFPMPAGVANDWVWSGTSGVTFSFSVPPRYRLG